jgi:hypothetical protein
VGVCFNFLEVESTCVHSVIKSGLETQRQATQHDCPPRLLGAEAKKVKNCAVRKIIFCTGLTRAGQQSIVPARQAQRTNQGRTPFICTLRFPICLSFSTAGVTLKGVKANPLSLYLPPSLELHRTLHPLPSKSSILPLSAPALLLLLSW